MTEARSLPSEAAPFLWRYIRRRPSMSAVLIASVTVAAICSVGVQYGMKLIVDHMSLGGRGDSSIWKFVLFFVVLIAVESALWRIGGWMGCKMVVATGVDVRLDLFRQLTSNPVGFFTGQMTGALGGRITATAGAVGGLLSTLIWHILPPCVDFLGAVIVLVSIDTRMAVALIGFAALVAVVIGAYGAFGRQLHRNFAASAAQVNGEMVDVVANIWTVKAFSARQREYERLSKAFNHEAAAHRRSWLYTERARVLHDVLLWFMAGGMLVWAIHGWSTGERTPGDVVVISALTFRILHGSRDLALSLVGALQHTATINEMLGSIKAVKPLVDRPGAPRFDPGPGHIRLAGVRYGYDPSRPVFENLNLEILPGQRVGIVGPSGGGKSTLLGLMQRFDDVQSGRIEIDGQAVDQVTQDSLREALSVVPQEISLFHRTIEDNIRYGSPSASVEELHSAAQDAECGRFIESLPEGYATLVGERGMRLSGGQRQRLGIARAILKDAPILLLDEATSALDSESEELIQAALGRLVHGRTVIAVAHRLSTVAAFDRIIVLVEGKIVEDGPPYLLREQNGLYAKLWRMQSEGLETQ